MDANLQAEVIKERDEIKTYLALNISVISSTYTKCNYADHFVFNSRIVSASIGKTLM